MFSCEFYEISKNTFFTEHLQWLFIILFLTYSWNLICGNKID